MATLYHHPPSNWVVAPIHGYFHLVSLLAIFTGFKGALCNVIMSVNSAFPYKICDTVGDGGMKFQKLTNTTIRSIQYPTSLS
jgi:hypothetical protein